MQDLSPFCGRFVNRPYDTIRICRLRAAFLLSFVLVLILVLIAALVFFTVLVAILIFLAVLVIHDGYPPK